MKNTGKRGIAMKKPRWLCVLLSCVLVIGAFSMAAHADFGDFGGDSDYGDYGGGGFDFGSDDDYDFGNDNDNDNDDNYYYFGGTDGGSSGSSGSGQSDSSIIGTLLFVAVIAFIIFMIVRSKKGGKKAVMPGAAATDMSTLRPVQEYLALDPSFSEAEFREKLGNMYVQFQNAWQAKDMEPLRPYLTDAMYNKCDRQLDALRQNHQTNRIERVSVLGVDLMGWKQEGGFDMMVARLRTRIVDYVVDDRSGEVIRGSNTAEKFMEYEWDLLRSSGLTTASAAAGGTTAQSCPHCGATIDINRSAKCPFCDSILTTDTFDWAVSEIKGLAQRTNG